MRVGLRSARMSVSIAARPSAEPWAQRAMASARVASSATPLKIEPSAPGALGRMTSACDGKPARDRNSADTAPRSGAAMCAKVVSTVRSCSTTSMPSSASTNASSSSPAAVRNVCGWGRTPPRWRARAAARWPAGRGAPSAARSRARRSGTFDLAGEGAEAVGVDLGGDDDPAGRERRPAPVRSPLICCGIESFSPTAT